MLDSDLLKNLIEESGLTYQQTPKSWIFTCPRCSKKKKLYIRKYDGRFVCFSCQTDGFYGRAEYALAELLVEPVRAIRARLGIGNEIGYADVYLDLQVHDFFEENEVFETIEYIKPKAWPFDYYPIDDPKSTRGLEYLESRGVPLYIANLYGIRYAPEKRRVVFPVSSKGNLYGWQERLVIPNTWTDEDGNQREIPKILTSPDLPRERVLMFVDRITGSHAVLCEGPFDALKAHLCGGNVATMGKAISSGQMQLLLDSGVTKLYLALDPDAAEEMDRLAREYASKVEMYDMVPQGGVKDLGDMDYREVLDLFHGATKVTPGKIFFFIKDLA